MTTKQQIRAEIERQMKYYDEKEQKAWDGSERGNEDALWYQGHRKMCAKLLSFLDTLPDESEQPARGYDEAYLNEKIAKASKSWEGVDVDKFMDEIRGREPVTDCHDLTEAAAFEYERTRNDLDARSDNEVARRAFKAGAEWMKRKMMEGAVAVEVVGEKRDLRLIDSTQRCLFDSKRGDWLKIIIVKEG